MLSKDVWQLRQSGLHCGPHAALEGNAATTRSSKGRNPNMQIRRGRRRAALILVGLALVLAAAATARVDFGGSRTALPWGPSELAEESGKTFQTASQGIENGGAGGEAF